jgi:RpiR family transcriptional regulator, carbohydrate utilization regulator
MAVAAKGGILSRLRYMSPYLNPALRRIAERVLKSPEEVKSISIKELAAECRVSESTVTRFVREIDVPSFQLFKILIAEELSKNHTKSGISSIGDSKFYEDIEEGDDGPTVISKISTRYLQTVQDTMAGLNVDHLNTAVEAIEQAETIAFFATGVSLISVENALFRFMRVGKSCQFFRDVNVRQVSTATLGPGKLAIGVSNSGRTISTVDAIRSAKDMGATTMCITSFTDSPIVRYSDIRIYTPTVTGPSGSAAYHESMMAKIAQLQVIDVLYSLYALRNPSIASKGLEFTSPVTSSTRY